MYAIKLRKPGDLVAGGRYVETSTTEDSLPYDNL